MALGIDIGSSSLKVVSLRRSVGGWKAVGAARQRVGKPGVMGALQTALGPRNGAQPGVVGLSGRDINLQVMQQPPMPPVRYRTMMGYELDQRKGEATDLYLDYCTLREPDQFFPQYLALIGIGKSAYVDERIDALAKSGVDVRDAVPNSFALFAAYRNAYDPENGTVMLLDVGSDNMDLAFVRGGRLIFARNVSSGARAFDAQIAGGVGCSPEQAEAMKVASANLGPSAEGADEEKEEEIRAFVRSAAGQLAGFITSSINHAKMQLNDRELAIDKVYLSGGGSRVRGLPEYLSGALKMPVELLDPFRKMDVTGIAKMGGEEFYHLPSDMAVAIGLAQLVSPPAGTSALSILPEKLKKRRNFFRTQLWLAAGGAIVAATLILLTGLAILRRHNQVDLLEDFLAKNSGLRKNIETMEKLEADQRASAAKLDSLQSYLAGGRVLLDSVARMKKALPPEIRIREMKMADPEAKGGRGGGGREPTRAAFTVRRRGLILGDIESENDQEIKVKGEAFRDEDIAEGIKGGVIRWPGFNRAIVIQGEIDENIRGGARDALNAMRDQLSDLSRGVRASIQNQRASDKPGWRQFEIVIAFD